MQNLSSSVPMDSVDSSVGEKDIVKDQLSITLEKLAVRLGTNTSGLGNPGALGLGGFALTTFTLSVFNAGLLPANISGIVVPFAFFYGGFGQLLAGLWEYAINNTFGATAFVSYGCFWLSFGLLNVVTVPALLADPTVTGDDINKAIGFFLVPWLIFSSYMLVGSLRVSYALATIFIFLIPTLLLLIIGNFLGAPHVIQAGGWFGIICSAMAWYCSAAVVINTTWKVQLIPLGVINPQPTVKVAV